MGLVIDFENLEATLAGIRKLKTVIHCHGVYDVLHAGHIRHLLEAKSLGDILVVSVTDDQFVNKGPGRPIFTGLDRAEVLAGLEIVDFVTISKFDSAVPAIGKIKPDIYVKGSDYLVSATDTTGKIDLERKAVEGTGGKIHFTTGRTMSSSNAINQINQSKSDDYSRWLRTFRQTYSEEQLSHWLDEAAKLRVLIVGEAILDDYVGCEALGKSSKDPVLAFRKQDYERILGGSLAVAKHAAGMASNVGVAFRVNQASQEIQQIVQLLPPELELLFLESTSEPTIIKTRFIDSLTGNKVFETYEIGDGVPSDSDSQALCALLDREIEAFDVVIVADYGHGLLDSPAIDVLCDKAKFLAVNTQSNAGNRGFNSISKYRKLDFACLNGAEISLEVRQRHLTVESLVPELLTRTSAQTAMVTNGAKGVAFADKTSGVGVVPGFASTVRDRVGAGDALFVTASLLLAAGAPPEIAALFGNLAGAASIAELGNRISINRVDLERHALALLK